MPNWCNNSLELNHPDPAMIAKVNDAFFVKKALFEEFAPVPEALKIVAGQAGGFGTPEQLALEAQEEANIAAYGYANWYDYCVDEWGTKWDVGAEDHDYDPLTEGSTQTVIWFESAWSPPLAFYNKLRDLGFHVQGYYYEPGIGFCGTWIDGNDWECALTDMTAEQVREAIPNALDEAFSISENIAGYEDEDEVIFTLECDLSPKDPNE